MPQAHSIDSVGLEEDYTVGIVLANIYGLNCAPESNDKIFGDRDAGCSD